LGIEELRRKIACLGDGEVFDGCCCSEKGEGSIDETDCPNNVGCSEADVCKLSKNTDGFFGEEDKSWFDNSGWFGIVIEIFDNEFRLFVGVSGTDA
jgi:hypothetical protein